MNGIRWLISLPQLEKSRLLYGQMWLIVLMLTILRFQSAQFAPCRILLVANQVILKAVWVAGAVMTLVTVAHMGIAIHMTITMAERVLLTYMEAVVDLRVVFNKHFKPPLEITTNCCFWLLLANGT